MYLSFATFCSVGLGGDVVFAGEGRGGERRGEEGRRWAITG